MLTLGDGENDTCLLFVSSNPFAFSDSSSGCFSRLACAVRPSAVIGCCPGSSKPVSPNVVLLAAIELAAVVFSSSAVGIAASASVGKDRIANAQRSSLPCRNHNGVFTTRMQHVLEPKRPRIDRL